jgi:hypothetical protein
MTIQFETGTIQAKTAPQASPQKRSQATAIQSKRRSAYTCDLKSFPRIFISRGRHLAGEVRSEFLYI